jgi:hypothetical protein
MTPHLFGIPVEFFLFALTLLGVALFHKHTMYVALTGLAVNFAFKLLTAPDFSIMQHLAGFEEDEGEWKTLLNLAGLLLGFAVLARHFELSGVPDKLPAFLPDNWTGGLVLLVIIMVLSSFLDNIASHPFLLLPCLLFSDPFSSKSYNPYRKVLQKA